MTATAPLGLLLDVDGPLASTVTRSLRLPSIAPDLVAIAHAGCPVVFNTGRSDAFLADHVVSELVRAGLAADAPVWGVGEKGATWFAVVGGRVGAVEVDQSLLVPTELDAACREIALAHESLMFLDETKRTMVSLEQHVEVDNASYLRAQPGVVARLEAALAATGQTEQFHVAASTIALDVEHRRAGKALGAQRAIALVRTRMVAPSRWYTAGDSASDYDMAAWLHETGYQPTHLDVRVGGAALPTDYPVLREIPTSEPDHAEDDITARYLCRWRDEVTRRGSTA